MPDAIATGLQMKRGSKRIRLLAPAAEGALHSGYDYWSALDFYYSEFRDRYLDGEVKAVITSVSATHKHVFSAFNIVPTPIPDRQRKRDENRRRLLDELRFQYKNAVARFAGRKATSMGIERPSPNRTLGLTPDPDAVDHYFAGNPAAIAAAAEIRALYRQIEDRA